MGLAVDGQVGTLAYWMDEGPGRAEARSPVDCDGLIPKSALVDRSPVIDVARAWCAEFPRSRDQGLAHGIAKFRDGYLERASHAAIRTRAEFVVFQFNEPAAHRLPAPAGTAVRLPAIEIARRAADIGHPVDRARSAERSSLDPGLGPAIAALACLIGEQPLVSRRQQNADPARHADKQAVVGWPALDQQHRVGGVGRQSVGEHAACRPCTDDDVVELVLHCFRPLCGPRHLRRSWFQATTIHAKKQYINVRFEQKCDLCSEIFDPQGRGPSPSQPA